MGRKKTHAEFILELSLVNPNIEVLGTYMKFNEVEKYLIEKLDINNVISGTFENL